MKRIKSFRLKLKTDEYQSINVPFCSDLLSLKIVNGYHPTLFFKTMDEATIIERYFILVYTNDEIPDKISYIDTFVIDNLQEYHLFELL